MKKSLYDILGVKKNASADDIKKAYKGKARESHPDNKETGDNEKMQELVRAYEVLGNGARRSRYDSTGQEDVTPFDVKLTALVQEMFIVIMEKNNLKSLQTADIIKVFKDMVQMRLTNILEAEKDHLKKLEKYKLVIERLESADAIVKVMKANIDEMELRKELIKEDIKFHTEAIEVLGDYRYRFDEPPPPEPVSEGYFTTWEAPKNENGFAEDHPFTKFRTRRKGM